MCKCMHNQEAGLPVQGVSISPVSKSAKKHPSLVRRLHGEGLMEVRVDEEFDVGASAW